MGRINKFDTVVGRAVVLAPAAMALWWFLLKGASLWLLRLCAWAPLALLVAPAGLDPVRVTPDGEWLFNVEVNAVGRNAQTGQRQLVSSLEFAVGENSVAFFACGWFSYIALAFSATRFSQKQAARVLKGAVLQTGINVLSLAVYVYINGYGTVINVPGNTDFRLWLLKYCYHMIYLVTPFASPFVVALLMHPEWRACFRPIVPQQAPA